MNLRRLVTALKRMLRRWVTACRMRRLDALPIPEDTTEIRLFLALRDEELRSPFLLKYYFDLGVDRIFVIDNDSQDGTVPYLLDQQNVHVFRTRESFMQKVTWLDWALRKYGDGYWCVVADCDELFIYPHSESLSLSDFTSHMDDCGFTAIHALLLDMYADCSWDEINYSQGQDPRLVCPYFDSASHRRIAYAHPGCSGDVDYRFGGGVRERVFGLEEVSLSKIPLFKFNRSMFLIDGAHTIERAHLANLCGVVLHFKFLQDFASKTYMDADRYEWGANEYRAYSKGIEKGRTCMMNDESVALESGSQLIEWGLMQSSPELDELVLRVRENASSSV